MALKAKKKAVETAEETVVSEETVVETPDSASPMTEDEKEAIQKAEEQKTKESADTRRLQLATNVVSSQFNLDPSYHVNKFEDKGKVVNLSLENSNFIISVTIKDSERHGMYVE